MLRAGDVAKDGQSRIARRVEADWERECRSKLAARRFIKRGGRVEEGQDSFTERRTGN